MYPEKDRNPDIVKKMFFFFSCLQKKMHAKCRYRKLNPTKHMDHSVAGEV